MARLTGLVRACGVLFLLGACGVPARAAEEGGATEPASSESAAARAPAASEDSVAPVKSASKPARPLTIVAGEAEAARLAALGAAVRGWPIKVVAAAQDEGASSSAALAVRTALQPSAKAPGGREIRLFTEQLHVVAGPQVTRLEDLAGRTVSFGPDGGRSQVAARKAFRALGIAVSETPLDLENALDGVATGDVAAAVLLAPQPVPRLKAISRSGLHLLAWPDGGALPAGAVATTIAANAYPNLGGGAVPALGAEAFLTLSSHGTTLPAAKRFMDAVAQHAPALSKRGFELMAAGRARPDDHHVASAEKR